MFVFHWLEDKEDRRPTRSIVTRFADLSMAEEYGYALATVGAERSKSPGRLLLMDKDAEIRRSWCRDAMRRTTPPTPARVDVAAVVAEAVALPSDAKGLPKSLPAPKDMPRLPQATDLETVMSEPARHTAEVAAAVALVEKQMLASVTRGRAVAVRRAAARGAVASRRRSWRSGATAALLAASLAGIAVIAGSQPAMTPVGLPSPAPVSVASAQPALIEGRSVVETSEAVAPSITAQAATAKPAKPTPKPVARPRATIVPAAKAAKQRAFVPTRSYRRYAGRTLTR